MIWRESWSCCSKNSKKELEQIKQRQERRGERFISDDPESGAIIAAAVGGGDGVLVAVVEVVGRRWWSWISVHLSSNSNRLQH